MKHPSRPTLLWSRLHFLLRFLGLTGALAFFAGMVLVEPTRWQDVVNVVGSPTTDTARIGGYLLAGGAGAALLALLVEALVVLQKAAGRRSAVGANAVVQVLLAAALLAGINWWSFGHSLRFDWTREKAFTLPADLRQELQNLDRDSQTTVVVYQRHKTFGALSDKPDRFDYAAERKVVEKVKDLVSQLREVGPQLRVEVLDVEEEGYDDKLRRLTEDAPELRKAIEAAPENSIFISSQGAQGKEFVQQMSFNELYQLDKVRSRADNGGRGNLVLLGQGEDGRGIRPFVRKVLTLEQRKPRVGVLSIHEVLSTEGNESVLSMGGLRKALTAHGFDVTDVILKKWDRPGGLQAAADTFEESQLDRLESELEDVEGDVKELEGEVKTLQAQVKDMTPRRGENVEKRLEELSEKYSRQLDGGKLTPLLRERVLGILNRQLALGEEELAAKKKERDRLRNERGKLNVDRISEARRLTDVKAKLAYALADCDLIVVPRLTRRANGELIPPRFYQLDASQVDAIKHALEAGKPLLACFGPINEPANMRMPPTMGAGGPDGLERALEELGIRMGRQTILTSADSKAFAERRVNPLRTSIAAPRVDLESPVDAAVRTWRPKDETLPPNPLREALRVTAHSVGKDFDIRLPFPRPIYYQPPPGRKQSFEPTFLLSPTGWNEEQPFATAERRPRYTPPSPTDPNNGTIDARRRGQFPIAVAVEVPLPEDWGKDAKGKTVRVAAIGQGEAFVGPLKPAQERLLLQTVNWLLGRDDYLPRADHTWSYPRLALVPDDAEHKLWLWGARLGLPVLFAYLGCVVLLFRRLR
jgi:hypothetical protein